MSETAKQLLARIEAIDTAAANNSMRAESYRRMADELKDAQGHGTSPDGVVSVVAGPGGAVTAVNFSERVRDTPPEVLSADIMRIPEMEILKTHCVMTVIGGEVVYEAK